MAFIEGMLAKYWTPVGTPLWRHHLPSILIATSLLAVAVAIGAFSVNSLIGCFIVIVLTQFVFGKIARAKFGDSAPEGSAYYKE
jgi:hypothetical protein